MRICRHKSCAGVYENEILKKFKWKHVLYFSIQLNFVLTKSWLEKLWKNLFVSCFFIIDGENFLPYVK